MSSVTMARTEHRPDGDWRWTELHARRWSRHGSQHSVPLSIAPTSIGFSISSNRRASGVISRHLPGMSIRPRDIEDWLRQGRSFRARSSTNSDRSASSAPAGAGTMGHGRAGGGTYGSRHGSRAFGFTMAILG